MRWNWTVDALEQVHANGLEPRDVQDALTGSGPRLIQPIGGDVLRVLARSPASGLIEVWLREAPEGEWDVWTAFEAGALGQLRWKQAFGQQGE